MTILLNKVKCLLIGTFLTIFTLSSVSAAEIGFRGNSVELYNQYKENPFAFKRKIRGKVIVVQGRIQEIGESFDGSMSLQLHGGDLFEIIEAQLQDSEEEKLLNLQRGGRVVLACNDIDEEIFVSLYNCVIVN